MSYREIEVIQIWEYRCRDCNFAGEADSVGHAEDIARNHIAEDVGDFNPRPNDNHTVAITARVLVGRNP